MPPTGEGRARRQTGHRATHVGNRRRASVESSLQEPRHQWNEALSSAAVILAGVLVVIGFGVFATRAMRTDHSAKTLPAPAAPALGGIPAPDQGLIPLGSPSPSAKPKPTPSTKATDPGAVGVTSGAVPSVVDLAAEGRRDWVHWGEGGPSSLERDSNGGFAILEGTPAAPRFRHALSPQRFRWTGGDPVERSDGTTTGIRTCGKDNGFTLTAPAGTSTRVLRLYIGVISAKGRLDATLSAGTATGSSTLEQRAGTLKTAVLTISFRAPKGARLRLDWTTVEAYGTGCGGVALEAATLR